MNDPNEIELAYGQLLSHMRWAARDGNKELEDRLLKAVVLFEELWPEDTARWRERWNSNRVPSRER